MIAHTVKLTAGVRRTPEFEKKRLAQFAVNVGTKCGHDCLHCSTGALMRMHPFFKEAEESRLEFASAIVYPNIWERVTSDVPRTPLGTCASTTPVVVKIHASGSCKHRAKP